VGTDFLGGLAIHVQYFPLLVPQKPQILDPFLDFEKIPLKMLTMEMLSYKLLLIVIAAPPKWHTGKVNKQCCLGNSKYVVILDPLPTGHVTRRMRSKPLTWANASLRLYISLTVQDRCMVTIDHP